MHTYIHTYVHMNCIQSDTDRTGVASWNYAHVTPKMSSCVCLPTYRSVTLATLKNITQNYSICDTICIYYIHTLHFSDGNVLHKLYITYIPADIASIAPDIINDIPTGNSVAKRDPTHVQRFDPSIISDNFSLTCSE